MDCAWAPPIAKAAKLMASVLATKLLRKLMARLQVPRTVCAAHGVHNLPPQSLRNINGRLVLPSAREATPSSNRRSKYELFRRPDGGKWRQPGIELLPY